MRRVPSTATACSTLESWGRPLRRIVVSTDCRVARARARASSRSMPVQPRAGAAYSPRASGLVASDVDHPGDAEPVGAHAELVAPHLLLQRHRHAAALGELAPPGAQLVGVVTAE